MRLKKVFTLVLILFRPELRVHLSGVEKDGAGRLDHPESGDSGWIAQSQGLHNHR